MLITSVAFIDGKNTRDHRASLLNQTPSCIDHCPKVPIILTQVLLLGLWVVDASVPYAGVGRWGNRSSLASKQSWASWAGRSIPQRRSSLGLKAPWRTRRSLWQRWAHWEKIKSPELWLREPSFTLQRNDRLGMSKQSVVPPKKQPQNVSTQVLVIQPDVAICKSKASVLEQWVHVEIWATDQLHLK